MKMPIVFEKVPNGDLTRKAQYFRISEFIRIQRTPEEAKKWYPGSYFLPTKFLPIRESIENFQVRPDDVWVVTFPKCGTTWTQEMVWQICNDLDFERGNATSLKFRFPYLDLECVCGGDPRQNYIESIENMPSPRLIKSHLPAPLLPKGIWTVKPVKPKIIYVARNAKDVAISLFHHYRNIQGYRGGFTDFLDAFLNDAVIYAPYDTHIADFWNMKNEENIHFITYEEMKTNLPNVIREIAEFLGKCLTDKQINILAKHLSFDSMSKNVSINYVKELDFDLKVMNIEKDDGFNFIRKGKVGSYLEEMSSDVIEKLDSWILKRMEKKQIDSQLQEIFIHNKALG